VYLRPVKNTTTGKASSSIKSGVSAYASVIGVDPLPYQLDYRLKARGVFVTTLLDARVQDGVADKLRDLRDCDLGLSPPTNLMPVRRHGLHIDNGAQTSWSPGCPPQI
jgi:hypothetical protein